MSSKVNTPESLTKTKSWKAVVRQAAFYGVPIGSILLLAIVKISWVAPVVFTWALLSTICILLSYSLNWAFILRKKSNGTIPLYIRWVFVPYLLYVHAYNTYKRYFDSADLFDKISDGLYVGARLNVADIETLKENGINCILDLTAEFDGLGSLAIDHDIEYLNIPVLDHASPKQTQTHQACQWIHSRIEKNKTVLVHCAMGRGRSVFTVAAYLLASKRVNDVQAALQKITRIRSTARLNRLQEKQLIAFHKQEIDLVKGKALIIANPVSGGGKWIAYKEEVLEYLQPYFEVDVLETTKEKNAVDLVKSIELEHYHTIVAGGGDGTVNEVAGIVKDTNINLGILPLGTANSLCQVLVGFHSKIMPINAACSAIIKGQIKKIDLAQCNNETMMLALGIGIEEEMIDFASRENKNSLGQIAYLQGFMQALSKNNKQRLSVTFDDDESQIIETNSLMIANAAPSSTILAQGAGNPDYADGLLDITWLKDIKEVNGHFKALGNLVLSTLNDDHNTAEISHRKAKTVTIEGDSELAYVVDGENRKADSIEVKIIPQCLSVYYDPSEKDEIIEENDKEDVANREVMA